MLGLVEQPAELAPITGIPVTSPVAKGDRALEGRSEGKVAVLRLDRS